MFHYLYYPKALDFCQFLEFFRFRERRLWPWCGSAFQLCYTIEDLYSRRMNMKNLPHALVVILAGAFFVLFSVYKDKLHERQLEKIAGYVLPEEKLPPGEYTVHSRCFVIETVKPKETFRCYATPRAEFYNIKAFVDVNHQEVKELVIEYENELDERVPKKNLDQLDQRAIKYVRTKIRLIDSGALVIIKLKNGATRNYWVWVKTG